MLEVEEVTENGKEPLEKEFPTLEELNNMREKLIAANLDLCQKELVALMEKYKMRLSCKVIVMDGKIEESNVIIIPNG